MYVSKKKFLEEKHIDLLLKEEEYKRYHVLIKDFTTSMYDHTLHRGKKHFVVIVLALRTGEKFQDHIKDC